MNRAVVPSADLLHLDLNTAPFLNEAAVSRALDAATPLDLAAYPLPDAPRLASALADALRVAPDRILVGNGSDEVLDLAIRALVPRGGSLAALDPSFSMYGHFARASGVTLRRIPARDSLPVDALAATRADAVFLASPNNPTGVAFPREEIEELVDSVRVPVLLDEAYAEFARQDLRDLASSRENVIVTRTFSKAYGLPGIRVGYGVGPASLMVRLRAVKMPYNLSSFGERAALAALPDGAFVERVVSAVEEERPRLVEGLRSIGWPVWPSRANFVFVAPLRHARRIREGLRDRGVLVKLVDGSGDSQGRGLRITVGTRAQNDVLLSALGEVAAWSA